MIKKWNRHAVMFFPYGVDHVGKDTFCFFDRSYNRGEQFCVSEKAIEKILRKSEGTSFFYLCDTGVSPITNEQETELYFDKLSKIMNLKLKSV